MKINGLQNHYFQGYKSATKGAQYMITTFLNKSKQTNKVIGIIAMVSNGGVHTNWKGIRETSLSGK